MFFTASSIVGTATVDPHPAHKNWLGSISLAAAHLLAFGSLYLILVQVFYAFEDHYRLIGYVATPRFNWIANWSNWIAAYTPVVLVVIAVDLIVVWRLARRSSRWTSLYSHSVLMTMGFVGFLWIAWMITPMVWSRPINAAPQVATDLQSDDGVRNDDVALPPVMSHRHAGVRSDDLLASVDKSENDR